MANTTSTMRALHVALRTSSPHALPLRPLLRPVRFLILRFLILRATFNNAFYHLSAHFNDTVSNDHHLTTSSFPLLHNPTQHHRDRSLPSPSLINTCLPFSRYPVMSHHSPEPPNYSRHSRQQPLPAKTSYPFVPHQPSKSHLPVRPADVSRE